MPQPAPRPMLRDLDPFYWGSRLQRVELDGRGKKAAREEEAAAREEEAALRRQETAARQAAERRAAEEAEARKALEAKAADEVALRQQLEDQLRRLQATIDRLQSRQS